jgi:HD superfamily phosphohydrolase YqeK
MKKALENIKLYNKLSANEKIEWLNIVLPIIESDEFLVRKYFLHHEDESLYEHLIKVSIKSFKLAKKLKMDVRDATIAGLLHDFYPEAWQYIHTLKHIDSKYSKTLRSNKKIPLLKKHGFIHGIEAKDNVLIHYEEYVNEKVLDAISKHMFPMSLLTKEKFPKYKESWIVTYADKVVSFSNIPKFKNIPKYFGYKNKNSIEIEDKI